MVPGTSSAAQSKKMITNFLGKCGVQNFRTGSGSKSLRECWIRIRNPGGWYLKSLIRKSVNRRKLVWVSVVIWSIYMSLISPLSPRRPAWLQGCDRYLGHHPVGFQVLRVCQLHRLGGKVPGPRHPGPRQGSRLLLHGTYSRIVLILKKGFFVFRTGKWRIPDPDPAIQIIPDPASNYQTKKVDDNFVMW